MPYGILTNEEDGIVVVRVWGNASREEHLSARKSVVDVFKSGGYKRLVVDLSDVDTQGITTPERCREIGRYLAGEEVFKDVRMAHVLPKNFLSSLDIQFVGATAAIRGKSIGEFATLEEAKEWVTR